jgi:hypothetical protein
VNLRKALLDCYALLPPERLDLLRDETKRTIAAIAPSPPDEVTEAQVVIKDIRRMLPVVAIAYPMLVRDIDLALDRVEAASDGGRE